MNEDIVKSITIESIAQIQNYRILKAFIKSEYENDKIFSVERIMRFIEILESKENKND